MLPNAEAWALLSDSADQGLDKYYPNYAGSFSQPNRCVETIQNLTFPM